MSKHSKRRAGEGSFFYHEKRGFRLRITYHDSQGRMRRKDFWADSKRAASEKASRFLEKTNVEDKVVNASTLEEWVMFYLKNFAANRVRPRTFEKYKSTLKYVVTAFGGNKLSDISTVGLQSFFTELQSTGGVKGAGLSTSTIRAIRRYLITVLDAAVEAELIQKNPARSTKAPRNKTRDMIILTKAQAKDLIIKAGQVDSEYFRIALPVIIQLTLHTGLRQGELFGLTWDVFDEDASTIFINKALSHIVGQGAVLGETKTTSSCRTVALTTKDVEMLQRYRAWQQKYAEEMSEIYDWHNNFMFTSERGYPLSPTNFLRRIFRPLLRECGIPDSFTFHQLRHYHASVLLEAGVSVTVIAQRLGHSSCKTTLDIYSHVIEHPQDKAVTALEEYIKD